MYFNYTFKNQKSKAINFLETDFLSGGGLFLKIYTLVNLWLHLGIFVAGVVLPFCGSFIILACNLDLIVQGKFFIITYIYSGIIFLEKMYCLASI